MRRSVYFLTPLIPLAVAACEDGPNQTFQPATGTLFNNGDTPAAVSDAGDPLSSTFGGSTKTQICAGDELQKQWGAMVAQPLAPVRFMAGLDLANGPTFPLLTIEQTELGPLFPIQNACVTQPKNISATDGYYGAVPGATPSPSDPCLYSSGTTFNTQKQCAALSNSGKLCGWNAIPATTAYLQANPAPYRLCQPVNLGPGGNGSDVGGSLLEQFGNNGEFQMEWAIPTHKAYVLFLNPGYVGHMTWNYLTPGDGQVHTYDYEIGYPVKKDGVNFEIDWLTSSLYPGQVDELYRGIASTYAPDIYDDPPQGVHCNNTGTCLAYANAQDGTGRALFGMRPVSFYMFFNPPTLPNPSGFTVQSAYLFNIKYAPYSGITSYFKMYDGPVDGGGLAAGGDAAAAEPFGDGLVGNQSPRLRCHFGMGNDFASLLKNCIDVFQVPTGCTAGTACDTVNISAQNKVLGDLAHDDQNYTFAVVGINQNFRPVKLDVCTPALKAAGTNCGTDTQDVIHDTDSPVLDAKNNLANTFFSDVRSFGAIQNDYAPPGSELYPVTACTATSACTGLHAQSIPYASCPGICDTSTDANGGTCVAAVYCKNYHGSAAQYREYGRLVQTDLNAQYVAMHNNNPALVKPWHDPSCYFAEGCSGANGIAVPPAGTTYTPSTCPQLPVPTNWGLLNIMEMQPLTSCTAATAAVCTAANPAATCNTTLNAYGVSINTCTVPLDINSWRAADGCTGFESWFTAAEPAPQAGAPTAGDDLWDFTGYASFGLGGGFKPGTPQAMFCQDPGILNFCGLSGDVQGLQSDLLGASTSRVLQYLGHGNTLNLPFEGRDRRYFFKQWSIAYAKYLISSSVLDTGGDSAGAPGANGLQVDQGAPVETGAIATTYIDTDDFIFDSFGGGASRSEFVAFALADANNDPVDVEQKILVLGSNLQATNFYRKLDREERAVFNMMALDKTQPSWGYLTTGPMAYDFWPADVQPAAACTTNAQCAGSAVPGAPVPSCNTNLPANDSYSGMCGFVYPRHNGNPFLTNFGGNAVLTVGVTSLPQTWATPFKNNTGAASGSKYLRFPAPAGWVDPCNPLVNLPASCTYDTDCPGVMACSANKCVNAVTAYFCATHSPNDVNFGPCAAGNPIAGVSNSFSAPLNPDGTMIRRANGKPLLEGYCSVWQPNPLSLTTNAITPTPIVPFQPTMIVTAPPTPLPPVSPTKNVNPAGIAAGIQIVKTFPDLGEALVSLPTYPNPYAPDPTANKAPVQVMVPWLPLQEGVGYSVPTSGSQDIFVKTAQLDFTGQVITPIVDFLPSPLACNANSDCSGGLTCQNGQCLAPGSNASANISNPVPPYGIIVEAIETTDFLGEVFLCLDTVTSANNAGLNGGDPLVPGDLLSAHMYSSAETIVNWLGAHPGSQDSCQVIVRYSPYDNYPDYITSLSAGVRLNIEQGAGYGRVVDATVFAPGTGVAAAP